MTYEEFGKLRFLDFFPKTDGYFDDTIGGTTTTFGLAYVDGYGPTGFARPVNGKAQTSEICLDFENECPEREGNALLDYLGIKIYKGMLNTEVRNVLGSPVDDDPSFPSFLVGTDWPYYVGCYIDPEKGLSRVWIARRDLVDKKREEQ